MGHCGNFKASTKVSIIIIIIISQYRTAKILTVVTLPTRSILENTVAAWTRGVSSTKQTRTSELRDRML